MARLVFFSFACYCVFLQLQPIVAPPPPIIEAYKPTSGPMTNAQDANSGFGSLNKLSNMLTKLQHQIDDINVRRKIMEAQMKSPFGFIPSRMEAALDYTDTSIPSAVYSAKIVSANNVFLQIFPDGTANGTREDTSPYANMTVEMVGVAGKTIKIMIKGTTSNKYLTCSKSKNGKFQAVTKKSLMSVFSISRPPRPTKTRSLLLWRTDEFVNLKCVAYSQWLLGFRHNVDKLKKGKHVRAWQLDSWFMIMLKRKREE